MLIAEVNMEDSGGIQGALERMNKLVSHLEQSPSNADQETAEELRKVLSSIPSDILEHQRLQLWKLSYRIWNACVDIANNSVTEGGITEAHVKLRHVAADMLLVSGENPNVRSSLLKMAMFFCRTGMLWQQIQNYEMAEVCFSKATELSSNLKEGIGYADKYESLYLKFDVYTNRARNAWELGQRALACNLLGRANSLISSLPDKAVELADAYLLYGRLLLSKPENVECASESVPYLEQAFEICSAALRVAEEPMKSELNSQKWRILRYLAGAHIQNQHFEAALKCTASLKATSNHASIPFLELKALTSLGRHEEAEVQLQALVSHEDCTAELGAAGIEAMLSSPSSVNTSCIKNAFFILQARFSNNVQLPLLVLEKLLCKTSSPDQIAAAIEIAQREAINSLIRSNDDSKQGAASQEQQCAFALLWNCGSERFQAKDYGLSRKLFETSMLYLPKDNSSIIQRAKALRVICLCHLATQQFDQAQECVNVAEQLDPTIASAFLKYKIALQTNDSTEASKQVEKMLACKDFEPEYLTLASHEAIACKCVGVAILALSKLLDLYGTTEQTTGVKEIVVIRNIVILLIDQRRDVKEILKYFKLAQTRLSQGGFTTCFGEGSMGIREASWFAGSSWNHGLEAGKADDWPTAAAFLQCAADFYSVLPESSENLLSSRRALLLAAAAILSPDHSLDDEVLRTATSCLEKYHKVGTTHANRSDLTGNDANLDVYYHLMMFDLKGKMKDAASQLEILNKCNSLPGFTADHLYKMAANAEEQERSDTTVASAALKLCLTRLLSTAAPDYKLAGIITRKLIRMADIQNRDSPSVLKLYQEAEKMLVGLPPDTYPPDEIHWLVTTAWNRAPLQTKFRRYEEAGQWMKVALDLLKHAPSMEVHRKMMEGAYNKVIEKKDVDPMEE